MGFKVGAYGRGLAALLGVGAIVLAAMDKDAWKIFLLAAFAVWVIPIIFKSLKHIHKNSHRRHKG